MSKRQTKAERAHTDRVAQLGCVACYVQAGVWGTPGEVHHMRAGCGLSQRASWWRVICLCPSHHRVSGNGKLAIHAGRKAFESTYGTEDELLDITLKNL